MLSKMDKKINLISFAYKAQKVLYGEKAFKSIKDGNAKLVLLASDTYPNTKKKVLDKCAYYNVPIINLYSRDTLSKAIGKSNIVILVVNEEGFAKNILNA